MKKLKITLATVIILALLSITAHADIDMSTISLSGTFPNFSFSDPDLGNVSLSYSGDLELYGISDEFAEVTLIVGRTGGASLTMSWSNQVTNLNLEIWDIDSNVNETVSFVTTATVSPDVLHPTDVWNSTTNTLSTDGTTQDNDQLYNFTIMNFTNAGGFNSITFNFVRESGRGAFGIGAIEVPTDTQPVLDIKANNSDGPVNIAEDDQLSIAISLIPGSYTGTSADWYIVVSTPSGWRSFDPCQMDYPNDSGLSALVFPLFLHNQDGLFSIDSTEIFSTTSLSAGTYAYYFGVVLSGQLYYDSVTVNVP